MTKKHLSISQTVFSLGLTGALVVGTFPNSQVQAQQKTGLETRFDQTLISVQFQPPGDIAPRNTKGGGTRGSIRFAPPGDAAPRSTRSGGTRGSIQFAPPGDAAPLNTANGGTRGSVQFAPPGDAAPVNTANGGTREEAVSKLVALIPQTQIGRTVAARPTFLVYVPATASKEVFFSLQDENRNHLYQTTLKISGGGGIVQVTVPKDAPELEIGKNYAWFFALIEPGDILRPDSHGVSGWVKRVEAPKNITQISSLKPIELAALYASSGIWYDTLTLLSAAKSAEPENVTLANEWKKLLQQVGLEAIATQPIVEQL
ncbi:MAG: DUF928 domain-containing protein [Oscillatoriaceae bacterium SKW80]|nr:DUF928 domain-containing protein [Oscillatoriaceae bacterium SKYG93]MCX8121002.1 DUF928 domain-containing protein [Oscillatoriaceae bacterium SKW80]MDW8452275.1 DUF928 domain-containing protein [Oscillatoriaceae cyanobacterium SKYGB_i_bin93]HIK26610.1 DUF928 domain-containing protein [Oscillatoriaceae cyanobacterium M7585_C2015_266]